MIGTAQLAARFLNEGASTQAGASRGSFSIGQRSFLSHNPRQQSLGLGRAAAPKLAIQTSTYGDFDGRFHTSNRGRQQLPPELQVGSGMFRGLRHCSC